MLVGALPSRAHLDLRCAWWLRCECAHPVAPPAAAGRERLAPTAAAGADLLQGRNKTNTAQWVAWRGNRTCSYVVGSNGAAASSLHVGHGMHGASMNNVVRCCRAVVHCKQRLFVTLGGLQPHSGNAQRRLDSRSDQASCCTKHARLAVLHAHTHTADTLSSTTRLSHARPRRGCIIPPTTG